MYPIHTCIQYIQYTPVDNVFFVKVMEATRDFRAVELGTTLVKAGVAHVVNVKLEVSTVHNGQHQTQRILRLKRVRQIHLQTK